ncbi:YHS domain-containing protein [Candidatus Bipolaricaulota bacterium]
MAIDPVCKMTVDEQAPAATSEVRGRTYYFCAQGCKTAFDQDPDRFIASAKPRSLLSRLNSFGTR